MRFAVLGHPIAHSKSPAMHGAAFRALGLAHTYEAIDCDEVGFEEHVRSLKDGKFQGFSVTVPHKLRALALADEIAESAKHVGAANTLVRDGAGRITAHNTDVGALRIELDHIAGSRDAFRGKTAVVIGTGGAARAAVAALSDLECGRVLVIGRDVRKKIESPLVEMVALKKGMPVDASTCAIVQATTCGMTGGPDGSIVAEAIDWDGVPRSAVAIDVVYAPGETDFLRAARAADLSSANGLGMLARQGALAFELWLKIPAPFDVMRAAIGG